MISSYDSDLGICLEPAGLGIAVCNAGSLGDGILPVLRKGVPIVERRSGNVTVKVVAQLVEEHRLMVAAVAEEVVMEAVAVGGAGVGRVAGDVADPLASLDGELADTLRDGVDGHGRVVASADGGRDGTLLYLSRSRSR